MPQSGMSGFNAYLEMHASDATTTKLTDSYFHADIVADAYKQGYIDGKKRSADEFMAEFTEKMWEKFVEKANKVYLSAKSLTDAFSSKKYSVDKIYINIFRKNPRVIVSVDETLLLDDDFVFFAYPKIYEIQQSFYSLSKCTLDISLTGAGNLDEELLKQDGFEYSEKI
jgi:hypothetical protein